jgi:hypothetical protein
MVRLGVTTGVCQVCLECNSYLKLSILGQSRFGRCVRKAVRCAPHSQAGLS